MLRVNNEYLDFNDDIEVEKRSKLFDDITKTVVDFSYSFIIAATSKNLKILGLPLPNSSTKTIFQEIRCDVIDVDGLPIYKGILRVERVRQKEIDCSFFSGNYNWISGLTGNMTDLNLSQYDVGQTEGNIILSWQNTSGIVFPFIDTGTLVTRSYENVKTEDFVGCFYLKTLFRETFQQAGFKIEGELLNDVRFNNIIIATNTRSKVDVQNNSIYVGKNSTQVIPIGLAIIDVAFNLTTSPYFIGSSASFTTSTEYTAAANMIVDIDFTWVSSGSLIGQILLNGVGFSVGGSSLGSAFGRNTTASLRKIKLTTGDVLKCIVFNDSASAINLTAGTFKITPKYIYKAFGSSCVPLWTKQQFVGNVLKLFNVVSDYNQSTKTVTLNLFDKIKTKTPIDISRYIKITEVDYVDFISGYGRSNNFSYTASDEDILKDYNISSFLKYGAGTIEVDNDYIDNSAEVINSDFTSPISYVNPVFNCSIEKINYVQLDDLDEADITNVTNSAGVPRFEITNADDFFEVGDTVRLNLTDGRYNGTYVVSSVTSTYIVVRGLSYVAATIGTATKLEYSLTNDDSVYLFYNIPSTTITNISTKSTFYINATSDTDWNLAFFNLLKLGRTIESGYPKGLSFGSSDSPFSFQRNMLQDYWSIFEKVLGDPTLLVAEGHIPKSIFFALNSLTPVYINTEEANGLYYLNRNSGYKNSYSPCRLELIKL
jgi:hypothetical protein